MICGTRGHHPLSLLPSPAYPGDSFDCNACGRRADAGFSYHCAECHFNLHVACTSKPLSVTHRLHPPPLGLAFYPPYAARGFLCDVCRGTGAYHWLYRCGACEFDAHLYCATGTVAQPSPPPRPQLQHHNSFSGATNSHWHQYPNQTAPAITVPTTQLGPSNHIIHSYSMGTVPNSQPLLPLPPPPAAAGGNNSPMGSASQTFVKSVADQAAKTLVQEMLSSASGGNDNGNDGSGYGSVGGGGDSSSTSIMGIGFSILSTVFGGSSDSEDQ
ncbi:hypothetical protein BT93_E0857 [Corymbia citriodora subsp. variegata]|nr:hypothetical protein BT93_E0857 [Corymbia citriodora subsp. variegata]